VDALPKAGATLNSPGDFVETRKPLLNFSRMLENGLPDQPARDFFTAGIPPSYCSAPQTWQTDAHRLMRDRHLRHILNRVRHHRNEDARAVKTIITTFWIIASRRFPARRP
jgi:hypothetical protein